MEGRIQIYTGNGKGKTTASLGLAVRAACSGRRVYIGQFMKGSDYSELELPEHFKGTLTIEQYGTPRLICKGESPTETDVRKAREGLEILSNRMLSGHYGLVVADEICVAQHMGLLQEEEVLALMTSRPDEVELVLTGRYATEAMIKLADLVTEMREIKHYYATEGLQARRGIEF